MRPLTPPANIAVPQPKMDEVYSGHSFGRGFVFRGLKELLGAADFSKAGDRHAGLAAATDTGRETARAILSGLTLEHLYDHPLTDEGGQVVIPDESRRRRSLAHASTTPTRVLEWRRSPLVARSGR